jgi:hypothetical protein
MPRTALRLYTFAVCLVSMGCFAALAGGATLYLSHPYGELVDRGEVTAHFSTGDGRHGCKPSPRVERNGREITITSRRLPPGAPMELCPDLPAVSIGELAAEGWWTVVLQFYESDGITPADRTVQEVRVRKPDSSCNRNPWAGSMLIVLHKSFTASPVVDRLASDPAYASALGSPVATSVLKIGDYQYVTLGYPVPSNPNDKRAQVQATGEFLSVEVNSAFCFSPPPGDAIGQVIEFYHQGLDHYFYSANAKEIAGLDEGTGAKGWARTGMAFTVLLAPGCPPGAHEQNAYRLYGRPGAGPDTHVFTVDRDECRIVDQSGLWLYESAPFWATPPDSHGACAWVGEIPLYRIWRPFGVSNHRFTTERAIVDYMKAKGWIDEGVAMCVRGR